jgi:Domain of unknown function (DU1801)
MAENKTRETTASVSGFIAGIEDGRKRKDAKKLIEMMKRVTGETPKMWGPSIIGFGSHHYRYESGREGDWPRVGFSPRKQNLVLYITDGFEDYGALLGKLGKHSTGKSCLYIKRLDDVDATVLETMVERSYNATT